MKCDRCKKKSVIVLPYGPHYFCKEHFSQFFEKRVRKTIRLNKLIPYGEKIAIGVSGGKDSMLTLHLLNKIFKNKNKIEAITIDEGIKGYRNKAIELVENYCKINKIKLHKPTFEETFNTTMDKIMKKINSNEKLGSSCSYCGVFRRELLNRKALEIKANKIATGHNLDDETQSIVMSFFNHDLTRLARLGEIAGIKKYSKFVLRIKPLYNTPEKEIIAYCSFHSIPYYLHECCPYSWMAKRNHYRQALNELEDNIPGTKHSIIASFQELKPVLVKKEQEKSGKIKNCKKCGNITNTDYCAVCRQLEKIKKSKPSKQKTRSAKKKSNLTCTETKRLNPNN